MLQPLDPILHSELRLAIVSVLMSLKNADFAYLQEKTGATNGNLGAQIKKLEEAGYIKTKKGYSNNRPQTLCEMTDKGQKAFAQYVKNLRDYIGNE